MATYNPVGPMALSLPIFKKLANRRVVLASASPRRKEIFANAVRSYPTTSYANHETVYMLIQIYQTQKRVSFLRLSHRLLQRIFRIRGSKATWQITL